jgi:hypothetical protein
MCTIHFSSFITVINNSKIGNYRQAQNTEYKESRKRIIYIGINTSKTLSIMRSQNSLRYVKMTMFLQPALAVSTALTNGMVLQLR